MAGGWLSSDTLSFLSDELESGLRSAGSLDGVALQLHGACAAEGVDDVEGYLLSVTRRVVGADIPIVMSLDHHANVTTKMVELSTAIVGHRTQPTTNMTRAPIGADLFSASQTRKSRQLRPGGRYADIASRAVPHFQGAHEGVVRSCESDGVDPAVFTNLELPDAAMARRGGRRLVGCGRDQQVT